GGVGGEGGLGGGRGGGSGGRPGGHRHAVRGDDPAHEELGEPAVRLQSAEPGLDDDVAVRRHAVDETDDLQLLRLQVELVERAGLDRHPRHPIEVAEMAQVAPHQALLDELDAADDLRDVGRALPRRPEQAQRLLVATLDDDMDGGDRRPVTGQWLDSLRFHDGPSSFPTFWGPGARISPSPTLNERAPEGFSLSDAALADRLDGRYVLGEDLGD